MVLQAWVESFGAPKLDGLLCRENISSSLLLSLLCSSLLSLLLLVPEHQMKCVVPSGLKFDPLPICKKNVISEQWK